MEQANGIPASLRWDDPDSDPIGDLRKWTDAITDSRVRTPNPVKVEVTGPTLQALRAARSNAQRDDVVSGLWWIGPGAVNIPIFTVEDVPDGKARVTYSDGTVEELPR